MQIYTLVEDRTWNNEGINFCTRGDFFECVSWIHKHTSHSFHGATTQQGYKLLDYKL
jgi:hypothetical protein